MDYQKIQSICETLRELTVIDRAAYLDYFNPKELAHIELYARRNSLADVAESAYRAGLRNCGIDYIKMQF